MVSPPGNADDLLPALPGAPAPAPAAGWQSATYVTLWYELDAAEMSESATPILDLVAAALRARTDVTSLTIVWSLGVGEAPALGERRAQAVHAGLVANGVEQSRLQTRKGAGAPDERGPGRGAVAFVIASIDGRPTGGEEQLSVDGDRAMALDRSPRFDRAVTLDRRPATPATPADAVALRNAEQACQTCQGLWGPHGMFGHPGCYCRTGDGGKSCRSSANCEGRCEIPYEQSFGFDGVRCGPKGCTYHNILIPDVTFPAGHCTDYHVTSGCRGSLEPVGNGGEVEIRRLCVD